MENLLIVSNSSSTMQVVSGLLKNAEISRISMAKSGAETRRLLLESEFDLIVIDSPLSDEFGSELALDCTDFPSGIILLVDAAKSEEMDFVLDSGVFVVPKPVAPELFLQAAKLLLFSRKRLLRLEDENAKLIKKMEEMRLVNRAKCILIQKMKMTEEQAHRYIEKQCMNLRLSKAAFSEKIIRNLAQ